jgi:tetratricopeptide (TPR) repeat protein
MFCLFLTLLLIGQVDPLERGRLLAQRGEVVKAIEYLESQARHEPSPQLFVFLAELQTATDRIPQAAESLGRALDLAPKEYGLRVTRAALLYKMRRLSEAEDELEMVLRQAPSEGLAHYYLAAVYQGQGKLDKALESAEKAVELLPPPSVSMSYEKQEFSLMANGLYLLAEILHDTGEDAEPAVRRVIELEPLHTSAHYLLSRILVAKGEKSEAQHQVEIFRKLKKAEQHVDFALNSLNFGGNVQQGVDELIRALEIYPDHDRAMFFLGRVLLSVGRVDMGVKLLERCVELRPEASALVEPLLEKVGN